MANESDEPIYRFTPQFDGAHLRNVPKRDLTQRDVDNMDPLQRRDAFSPHPLYGTPLYVKVGADPEPPKWFQEKQAKAGEGVVIEPMLLGETQKAYEDRVAAMQPTGDGAQTTNDQASPDGGNDEGGDNEPSGDGDA